MTRWPDLPITPNSMSSRDLGGSRCGSTSGSPLHHAWAIRNRRSVSAVPSAPLQVAMSHSRDTMVNFRVVTSMLFSSITTQELSADPRRTDRGVRNVHQLGLLLIVITACGRD